MEYTTETYKLKELTKVVQNQMSGVFYDRLKEGKTRKRPHTDPVEAEEEKQEKPQAQEEASKVFSCTDKDPREEYQRRAPT